MFEATLRPAPVLKAILNAIKKLVTDVQLECSRTGVAMQSMDSAHVALVQFILYAEEFESFRCDYPLRLGIHIESLCRIINLAKKDDAIKLSAKDSTSLMSIKFVGKTREAEFTLKLLNIEADILGIPDTSIHSMIKMPSKEFKKVCSDLSVMGTTVRIETQKQNRAVFKVEGDMGRGTVTYSGTADSENWQDISVQVNEPLHQSFALGYLALIAMATPLSNQVILKLTRETPLSAEYSIEYPLQAPEPRQYGYIRFWLAPKLDEDS